MIPKEIPGLSRHPDWGSGMIEKGIRGNRGYKETCERALILAEVIFRNKNLLDNAWIKAKVQGSARKSLAALTLWLARGREVHDSKDGVRGNGKVIITPPSSLVKIIVDVEREIITNSKQ